MSNVAARLCARGQRRPNSVQPTVNTALAGVATERVGALGLKSEPAGHGIQYAAQPATLEAASIGDAALV